MLKVTEHSTGNVLFIAELPPVPALDYVTALLNPWERDRYNDVLSRLGRLEFREYTVGVAQ